MSPSRAGRAWFYLGPGGFRGCCLPSVSPVGLFRAVIDGDRHVASGAAVFPQAPAAPTWKPPLNAWGRGHTPAISQGPFPVRVLTGIRGLRSGANSICLCSFHAMSRSVLPATSNFLDKGSAEGMGRGPAKHPWESPGSFSAHPPPSAHTVPIQSSKDSKQPLQACPRYRWEVRQGTGASLRRVPWLFVPVSARQGPQLCGQDGGRAIQHRRRCP